jgi:hypothetical protein
MTLLHPCRRFARSIGGVFLLLTGIADCSMTRDPTATVLERPGATSVDSVYDSRPVTARPDPRELGEWVASVYRQLSELEFDATVSTSKQSIRCRVRSDRDGHHQLDVRTKDDVQVYQMIQTPLSAGRIQFDEFCPIVNKRIRYVLSDKEFSDRYEAGRRWDPRLIDPDEIGFDACLFGGYLRSWLGDDSHRSDFFGRTIAEGAYGGLRPYHGDACHVIRTSRPQRPGEEIWIDARSGLVRRWRDPVRDREFSYRTTIKMAQSNISKND